MYFFKKEQNKKLLHCSRALIFTHLMLEQLAVLIVIVVDKIWYNVTLNEKDWKCFFGMCFIHQKRGHPK